MIEALLLADPGGHVARFCVVLLRTSGIVVFLPVFGSEMAPFRVRMLLAVVLAVAMLPLLPDGMTAPHGPGEWLTVAVRELSVGLGLGLVAKAFFAGVEAAASVVAGQSGFALASMVDPLTGDQALAPALFQNMLAIAMFLAADLHHLLILAVRESYELLPPMVAAVDLSRLGEAAGALGHRLFAVGVGLSAPALLLTFSVDLLLGLVGRAMTQIPILLVGYPIKMVAGLIALAVLATTTGSAMNWIGRTIASDGVALLAALRGAS